MLRAFIIFSCKEEVRVSGLDEAWKYFFWVKPVALEVLRHEDVLVPQGIMTWESPGHPAVIMRLTTLPEMHMAVTVDIESTIKLWDYQNREALATNNLSSPCQLLKAVDTKDGPIVLVSDPQIWSSHTDQTPANLRSH